MPALAAAWLPGRTVSDRDLDDVQYALGPRLGATWDRLTVGSVGLLASRTSAAYRREATLARDGAGLAVVGDLRLNNLEDLRLRLDLPREIDEGEVLLAAYRRWGSAFPGHLDGAFAICLWDQAEARLLLARDVFGLRPLVYRVAATRIVAGSSARAIASTDDRVSPLNTPLLRDFLEGRFRRWVSETAWADVQRVPPGVVVTITGRGVSRSRFAMLGDGRAHQRLGVDETGERFFELLSRSIAGQLAGVSKAGVLLSGGIDSTAVTWEAHRQLTMRGGRLTAYSAAFVSVPSADEQSHQRAVVTACPGLLAQSIPADGCWAFREFGDESGFPLDEPEILLNRSLLTAVLAPAVADGCEVVLWGAWADQLLQSGAYHATHLIWDIPRSQWRRELPRFHRWRPGAAMAFFLRAALGRGRALVRDLLLGAPGAIRRGVGRHGWALQARAELHNGRAAASTANLEALTSAIGARLVSPFSDRALAEFVLSLPGEWLVDGGRTKVVLRKAFAGRLPTELAQRTNFAHFSDLDLIGGERERAKIKRLAFARGAVLAGLVSPTTVARRWQAYTEEPSVPTLLPVARLAALEAWLSVNSTAPRLRHK